MKLKLPGPMLADLIVHIVIYRGRPSILKVGSREMRGRRGQGTAGEGVLGDVVLGLGMVRVMMLLIVVGVMSLRLILVVHLHGKPLMTLTAIHHDMLWMALSVHSERVQRG